jgi:hypothetical protein
MPKLRSSPRALAALAALVVAVVVVVVLVVALGSGSSGPAVASLPTLATHAGPESIFTPGPPLKSDPAGTLDLLEKLGVDRVRVFLSWNALAPAPEARAVPAGFNAADPAAYPASSWLIYDTIARDAKARGMGLDMVLGPPPPRWASGRGAPDPAAHPYWRPSAPAFGQFTQAVGTRYSGHYVPPGATKPLPRVAFWSIWNEPNSGVQLAPQAIDHSTVEVSSMLYRKLADAGWKGLQDSGHAHDTILIGELAPAGSTVAGAPGNFAVMAPLRFLRALYCVGSDYRPLRGRAATARGCPPTAAGSAAFTAAHPALFHATGIADHPYPQGLPPDKPTPGEPDFAELAEVPRLIRTLDTLQRTYGSSTRFPVYSTEFGYQTTPPDTEAGTVSPTLAAEYLNWSEYLTWREPRLVAYDQYLLEDPLPAATGPYLGFATGLSTYLNQPKPGFYAYRMPLFMPAVATAAGHALEVWGCARPATYARLQTHRRQSVAIQFRAASGSSFATVQTVTLSGRSCYFDVRAAFSGSGSVRLRWSYPHGPTIFSRTVGITVG